MSLLGTRIKSLTEYLAHEYAPEFGYCRETATVTVEAGMDVGSVLVLKAGKYVWVNTAEVSATVPTSTVAVLVESPVGTGDQSLAVLLRGPAGVVGAALVYKGTVSAGDKATVLARFKTQGIVSRTRV